MTLVRLKRILRCAKCGERGDRLGRGRCCLSFAALGPLVGPGLEDGEQADRDPPVFFNNRGEIHCTLLPSWPSGLVDDAGIVLGRMICEAERLIGASDQAVSVDQKFNWRPARAAHEPVQIDLSRFLDSLRTNELTDVRAKVKRCAHLASILAELDRANDASTIARRSGRARSRCSRGRRHRFR